MKKGILSIFSGIWISISRLGMKNAGNSLDERTLILSNQLNFVLAFASVLLLIYTVITQEIIHMEISVGTARVFGTMLVCVLNLLLAYRGYTRISMISLIFLPSVIFLLVPTLIGYVEEEGFTYYPVVAVGMSVIPQLLLHPSREKYLYWISLLYFLLLVLFLDNLMMWLGKDTYPILDRIRSFYAYYKIAPVGIFLFINACIYYLRQLNLRYENDLHFKNLELDMQNRELSRQKDEIESQKNELLHKETITWQRLVSIISHEIVNSAIPITNLAGMTGQMLDDDEGKVLSPELIEKETVRDIRQGLKVIESRTKALINFVRATKSLTNIPKPHFRLFSVGELFERIRILYQGKFGELNIRFTAFVTPPEMSLHADLELIEQVLINLIQNSFDAVREKENPEISLEAISGEAAKIVISVSDNGPGIGRESREKIFLPFYTSKPENSGIGLSLSQQIMQLHEGRLEFRDRPGGGTIFTMSFS
ncbi:MAG TPA: HAMP domain-containing sensor histidine kinase [Bacteroidales bacterium]|nr:HAMP domain-containing sensor histidine kinase [Bacteroidales bacterium]